MVSLLYISYTRSLTFLRQGQYGTARVKVKPVTMLTGDSQQNTEVSLLATAVLS